MKKIRLFLNPIEGREKWLNKLANENYKLISTNWNIYEFEKTSEKMQYAVQYIGEQNYKEINEYIEFMEEATLDIFTIPLNVGKLGLTSFKIRPVYGKLAGVVSPRTINKELIILGRKDEGKSFEIFNDMKGSIRYKKAILFTTCVLEMFFLTLALFGSPKAEIFGTVYTNENITIVMKYICWAIVAIIAIFIVYRIADLIKTLKEKDLNE